MLQGVKKISGLMESVAWQGRCAVLFLLQAIVRLLASVAHRSQEGVFDYWHHVLETGFR